MALNNTRCCLISCIALESHGHPIECVHAPGVPIRGQDVTTSHPRFKLKAGVDIAAATNQRIQALPVGSTAHLSVFIN